MTSEYDKQRDIEAEGQRAAIYHNSPLAKVGGERLIGISPEGNPINNVTEHNRYDVDKTNPWVSIALMSEDLSRLLKVVRIPRTREFPDVVMYNGTPYTASNTNKPLPQYAKCMVATAVETEATTRGDTHV